jgi:quercetin dioxygenase-like cupin family protein
MKTIVAMSRTCHLLAVLTAVGIGGAILAQHVQHAGKGQVKVTQLSRRDIIEKLDGKESSATVLEVTFEPGEKDTPHRHAGPVFGYVLEGEYEHALNEEPIKSYKAGDTFYEPTGSVHRVARNPSAKTRTRLLAVILHPRDIKDPTIREERIRGEPAMKRLGLVAADPLPVAGPIPPDQLRRHGRDVLAALDKLQCPLPAATTKELRALSDGREEGPSEFSIPVQKLLDAHCLIGVSINHEGQVKAARGPAEAVLREGADTVFLVKVANDAGITHPVNVSGPQLVTAGEKNEDRWLEAAVVAPAPLKEELSGARVEYVLLRLRPREAGKREATLRFDVGEGSQGLGFGAEVPILFTIKPAPR